MSEGRVTTEIVQHERGPMPRSRLRMAKAISSTPVKTQLHDAFLGLMDDDDLRLAVSGRRRAEFSAVPIAGIEGAHAREGAGVF